MKDKSFWVISYDIKDDRRRTHIAKRLKDYGTRVQYSVFECILPDDKFQELIRRLKRFVKEEEDSIRFYRICEDCQRKIFIYGKGEITEDEEVYII